MSSSQPSRKYREKARTQSLWRHCLRVAAGIFGVFFVWWFYLRAGVPIFPPWVTWSSGGEPYTITFHVTQDGHPLSAVVVDSESTSGTAGAAFTDANGIAMIRSGESEVISIEINHQRIPLRPLPPGELFFLPGCHKGLAFQIAL